MAIEDQLGPESYKAFHQAFKEVKAVDEFYIAVCFALLEEISVEGEQQGVLLGPRVLRRRVTYCHWGDLARNPVSFSSWDEETLRHVDLARKEGCLFFRKVAPGALTAATWIEFMRAHHGGSTYPVSIGDDPWRADSIQVVEVDTVEDG